MSEEHCEDWEVDNGFDMEHALRDLSSYQRDQLRTLFQEMAKRDEESLKLYEPLPFQQRYHKCTAPECVLQGANQVGKSLAAFAEDARAVTGQDPHNKYPKEDGLLVCIGENENAIGMNIYRYLFQPGAFDIIQDERTGKWRAFKPWLPEDQKRAQSSRPAPPLIPPRMVKNISWRNKGAYIFHLAELINGWRIYALSSKSDAQQGFRADVIHIDEDLARPEWYDEMIARLTHGGKPGVGALLRWSALPHARNDKLVNLIQRAEDDVDKEEPMTVAIRATIFDNPFIPERVKQANIRRWTESGEDEYRKRALGELVQDSILVYPTFSKHMHSAIRHEEPISKFQAYLTENEGRPGQGWARYAAVDPGHTVCAVTFFAVPDPKQFGEEYVYCYDELYMKQCNAEIFGERMFEKTRGAGFEAFIIDAHGGRLRELGSGELPRTLYSRELEKWGVRSRQTGSGFISGSDNIPGRETSLRSWLHMRPTGTTKIVFSMQCHNLVREFIRFKKKVVGGIIQEEANRRFHCHAIETVEYAAAHGLPYVKPRSTLVISKAVAQIIKGRKDRAAQRAARDGPRDNSITLGPET